MLSGEVFRLKMSQSQLKNVFIADENYPFLDNHIFLLYEFTGEPWFLEFEDDAKSLDCWELTEDKDKYHVMMVFKVPAQYKEDYKLFKESKYSKMSTKYKEKIQSFHALHKDHPILDVLYKRERAYKTLEEKLRTRIPREQEASSLLEIKNETYFNTMKKEDPMKTAWELKV